MITLQVVTAIAAILVFLFWDKLKALASGRTINTKYETLQSNCLAIIDIGLHLYQHDKPEAAKQQLELIGTLVDLYREESPPLGPDIDPIAFAKLRGGYR